MAATTTTSEQPADGPEAAGPPARTRPSLWVERLTLTSFRSYARQSLLVTTAPVVLVGPNGAGKTNILEALSLLAPGQGLRRAPFSELARSGGDGSWAVSARMHTRSGVCEIGTGQPPAANTERSGRIVRIDGEPQSGSGALAALVEVLWLTPAMDGLFTGPASERRRFLDRLILAFDPGHATRSNRFERAMQARNRLLAEGVREEARLAGFEIQMAETGVAIAAARAEAVSALGAVVASRRERDPTSPFPWSQLALSGELEDDLHRRSALDVEEAYQATLRTTRERDRAAARTLSGPHRSDLLVTHGPKAMAARLSSTGEQKALLVGILLAHAELLTRRHDGFAPLLLLDEITAHLDEGRRAALFAEILRLGAQAWMTGTDLQAFAAIAAQAQVWRVGEGGLSPA